jgi:5,10-methylenetetrahydromethanopterin reductase
MAECAPDQAVSDSRMIKRTSRREVVDSMTRIHFGVARSATDILEYLEWVKLVNTCGYELIGFGDSQNRWAEMYSMLALTAANTTKPTIGPFITNPVTRHPAVAANAMATLQLASGGRAFFGIGHGETSIRDLGGKPSSREHFESYVHTVRALCAGEQTEYQGVPMKMLWEVPRVPIWVAGDGPKMLQLAGRVGDAVIVGNGATPELVKYAHDQIRIGAEAAGRDASTIDVWFMVRVVIADSEAAAFEQLRFYLATYANTRYRNAGGMKGIGIPPEIEERLAGFRSEFRFNESLRSDLPFNADLVDKYGLREWLGQQFAVAGSAEQCIERLENLARVGGTHIVLPQLLGDPSESTREFAEKILPAFE